MSTARNRWGQEGRSRAALLCFAVSLSSCVPLPASPGGDSAAVLSPTDFAPYVAAFNAIDVAAEESEIPNPAVLEWMAPRIPYFDCPDSLLETIYYFRWWTYRKHIRRTPLGYVITEFILPVKHAGPHNTISCALGHHIYEGRWLRDQTYVRDYIRFWLRGHDGGPQPHLHRYSNWLGDAVYAHYLVHADTGFVLDLLEDLVRDYLAWETERLSPQGLFWQYDVRDGMEESISGSRTAKHRRPTINSYMYANARAIAALASLAGRQDLAEQFVRRAQVLKEAVEKLLWDPQDLFFKVRLEGEGLSDAREAIGFIPWQFCLPDDREDFGRAWLQLTDTLGFWAPWGLTTAERRHPRFRSHGVGSCEWDGAVWPFATSQTLTALANLLHHYRHHPVSREVFFEALRTYARSHQKRGQPYLGEYLDEKTGAWLRDEPRSRYYNHSTFCDLVITGLIGLIPRADDTLEVDPLLPAERWDFFCLDHLPYHGHILTILWDCTGQRYGRGAGFRVFADGILLTSAPRLTRIRCRLPR
ncbi:MAG: trehalase family glycosidase [candidate division KSB1 bacterium]|nr:trehalase family glycosidase [candidate division KSB1 bacterium]